MKVEHLLEAGVLERVPTDPVTAAAWLEEAHRHLEAARAVTDLDGAGCYLLLYNAARKAITAHMLASGLRARTVPGAHQAVATYALEVLGRGPHRRSMERFDAMLRNRNRADYGVRRFGRTELETDRLHAERIVDAVEETLGRE